MALLKCPDCGGNVSSKAAKCPRCGCPVSVMIQEEQKKEAQQTPDTHTIDTQEQTVEADYTAVVPEQTVKPKQTVKSEQTATEQTATEQIPNVQPTNASSGNNTLNHNVKTIKTPDAKSEQNKKWMLGAIIAAAIIVAIVVIVVLTNRSSSSYDYDSSKYEQNYETITVNGVSFKMIKVEGGTFQMGGSDSDAYDDEKPVHSVTLSDFYIGETEVTQSLWQAVMGGNPSYFRNGNLPVEDISWYDCQEFIQRLNAKTGKKFGLPTEAQWEYAALGGKKRKGYQYSGSNNIFSVGWFDSNSKETTHNVKALTDNELGLYDMTGNVYEWCQDWYADRYDYNSATDPTGPYSGTLRVVRSGSWKSKARNCRTAYRFKYTPEYHFRNLGLRLCISTTNTTTVDNSDAISRQRLMDFQKKITSYPFEKDAVEIIKVIDNNNTKCLFFKGQLIEYSDENGACGSKGVLFLYNAASDGLYELINDKLDICNLSDLNTKKYNEWDMPPAINAKAAGNSSRSWSFKIYDLPYQQFFVELNLDWTYSNLMMISLSNLRTKVFHNSTIYDNKYIIQYENDCPIYIDTRTYTVKDLKTLNNIPNPFIQTGDLKFYGSGNTSVNLTVNNNASVTGRIYYEGEAYYVEGSETIGQEFNLHPKIKEDRWDFYFVIKQKNSQYFLEKVIPVAEYYEVESSVEIFKR